MKYFTKPDGSIWAFELDGSQDNLITADMVAISDAALAALREPTPAQVQAANEVAIQTALDAKAQSRGYTDIKSACAYASTVPSVPSANANFAVCEKFRLEGNALQSWMSLTWATAYAYLATVTAGTNPMPTAAEAVAMIPAFTWPD